MLPAQAGWDQRVVERPQDSGCDAGSAEDIPKSQPRSYCSAGRFGHFGQQPTSFSNSLISSLIRSNGHDWSTGTLTP